MKKAARTANKCTFTRKALTMADTQKYDRILDALQQLMIDESIQNISVSDIATKAGIGKGSIYYYFRQKKQF